MQHPFQILRPEYEELLTTMRLTRVVETKAVAQLLVRDIARYKRVSDITGVPAALIAALDERESSANPRKALGQGDPWNQISTNVPRGKGPFKSWEDAAVYYINYDHLNDLSVGRWSWPYVCWKGEAWNGFGPRDHGIHTGYLWAGTNHYQRGKYVSDGKWDSSVVDRQLGIIPVMRCMIGLDPSLAFDLALPTSHVASPTVLPIRAPLGVGGIRLYDPGTDEGDVYWVQTALNKLQQAGLRVDGSFGHKTREALRAFQASQGLALNEIDGLYGPKTRDALVLALKGVKS